MSSGCGAFDEQSDGTTPGGGHPLGGATNVSSPQEQLILVGEEMSKIGSPHPQQKHDEKGWLRKHSTVLLEYGYLLVAARTTTPKQRRQPLKREGEEPEDAVIKKEIIRTFCPAHRSSTVHAT
jgi:hypothetical protein